MNIDYCTCHLSEMFSWEKIDRLQSGGGFQGRQFCDDFCLRVHFTSVWNSQAIKQAQKARSYFVWKQQKNFSVGFVSPTHDSFIRCSARSNSRRLITGLSLGIHKYVNSDVYAWSLERQHRPFIALEADWHSALVGLFGQTPLLQILFHYWLARDFVARCNHAHVAGWWVTVFKELFT